MLDSMASGLKHGPANYKASIRDTDAGSSGRVVKSSLLAGCLSFAAAIAIPAPSVANPNPNFDIYGTTGHGGAGESQGEFQFDGSVDKNSSIGGRVRDLCESDGLGIQLSVKVRYLNSNLDFVHNVIQDVNGCGLSWVQTPLPYTYQMNAKIDDLKAQLWATDEGERVFVVATSSWKDNPYT